MNIFITGGSGFLGSYLIRALQNAGDNSLLCLQREGGTAVNGAFPVLTGDLAGIAGHREAINAFKPDAIVHLGAVASPAACAADPDIAAQVNFEATRKLNNLAAESGAHLIFLSTDWVFDAAPLPEGGFTEQSEPNSRSTYGTLKLRAERAVLGNGGAGAVLRSSLLYGSEINGRRSTLTWLEDGLRGLMNIQLIEDEWRTPAFVEDAVQCLLRILELRATGIFHCAGPERLSRAEFGEQYARCFGISPQLIKRVKRQDVPELRERPEDLSMNCQATCRALDVAFRSPGQAFQILKHARTA